MNDAVGDAHTYHRSPIWLRRLRYWDRIPIDDYLHKWTEMTCDQRHEMVSDRMPETRIGRMFGKVFVRTCGTTFGRIPECRTLETMFGRNPGEVGRTQRAASAC